MTVARPMAAPRHAPRAPRRRRGQAMVEYVIILPALLMIILGAIQMALIYQAKSTLNYATFLAARQGALHNGKLCVGTLCNDGGMRLGLASGLAPPAARKHGAAGKSTVVETIGKLVGQIELESLAEIVTLNPTAAWVKAATSADPYTGAKGVPNDNLMYRSTARIGSGKDGMSLQDGNLLKIRVTYCFKLEVPFANQIIYAFNNLLPAPALPTGWAGMADPVLVPGRFCNTLNAIPAGQPTSGRYLPIVATAVVRMQSRYIGP